MRLKEFSGIFQTAIMDGANKAFAASGIMQDQLTKAEAYRRYGRDNVDRWLKEGLLKPSNKHAPISPKLIDRAKLESVAETSNRITYLPVAER
jgi:hypothetical protein